MPHLVVYSLVGNDVCDAHSNTLDDMITVELMSSNLLNRLSYPDAVLPKGSHVYTAGLVNNTVLYQQLHDHIYPLGRAGTLIARRQIYSYLSRL